MSIDRVLMRSWSACRLPVMALLVLGAMPVSAATAPQPQSTIPDNSEIHFTVGEAPLLELMQAATPYVITVGNQLVSADLILLEPKDLRLSDGKASLKIRVKGRTLPIDQSLSPEITLVYDKSLNKYFGVLSSLPLSLPGLGTIDLKDYVSRVEIPTVLENLWRVADKPIELNLKIRRIAILDHALEMGADVNFAPLPQSSSHSAR